MFDDDDDWISVKDRLPENGQIVCVDNRDLHFDVRYQNQRWIPHGGGEIHNVIKWKPQDSKNNKDRRHL